LRPGYSGRVHKFEHSGNDRFGHGAFDATVRDVIATDETLSYALLGIDKLTISVTGMWDFRACFDLKMTS